MVALRTSVFVSESNEVEPNKKVCVEKESLDSNILESMLFKVLRRVCLLSWNIRQWRRKWEVDSILGPQLQGVFKQFWKLYLNLCSCKSLNSSPSRVINLIPLRLQQLKKLFGFGLINLRIFLKIPKFSELRRLGSRLFHSMIGDGKTFYKSCAWYSKGGYCQDFL